MPIYTHQRYEEIVNETVDKIKELSKLKGGEYAGDTDRLANFRRNGAALGLPMETIWAVYAAKHWDAIQQYVSDLRTGTTRARLEPIEGRLDDLIVYCILMKAMVDERKYTNESAGSKDPRYNERVNLAEVFANRIAEGSEDRPSWNHVGDKESTFGLPQIKREGDPY